MPELRFLVADSVTGRLVGRLSPGEWSWTDPLTGPAEGSFRIPLPTDTADAARLQDLLQPQIRQILAQDATGRYWFGGPVTADPQLQDYVLTVPTSDWRAWFYAAAIRPNADSTRRDYIQAQVEQCQAMAALAGIALDTAGAPRLVVDAPPDSTILRDVTARMFTMTGEVLDNIAQRERGPDWWTYLAADAADPLSVVAHLAIGYPERQQLSGGLTFRHQLQRRDLRVGGNVLSYTWPQGNKPTSRVFGVSAAPAPGEEWATAEDPGLEDGTRLAWDEVWQLPDEVNTAAAAFEHALSRLQANSAPVGVVEVAVLPSATDVGAWGPGDRVRLVVSDGWREIDLPQVRVLSRTLTGRGGNLTGVSASLNLAESTADIEEPTEVAE